MIRWWRWVVLSLRVLMLSGVCMTVNANVYADIIYFNTPRGV